MAEDGMESTKIDDEIFRLSEKQKLIINRKSSHAVLLLIDDLYGSDIESLKSDFTKYMFFKSSVIEDRKCLSNLDFLLKIRHTLDKLLDGDYSCVVREIKAREAEAEMEIKTDAVSSRNL